MQHCFECNIMLKGFIAQGEEMKNSLMRSIGEFYEIVKNTNFEHLSFL